VHRIYEHVVELTITADEVAGLPRPDSRIGERVKMSSTARRAQRLGRNLKDRWERR
jgi:hypothetical protein